MWNDNSTGSSGGALWNMGALSHVEMVADIYAFILDVISSGSIFLLKRFSKVLYLLKYYFQVYNFFTN